MELPEPAIRWLAEHASSNTELACLSNVCKKWREIVTDALIKQAQEPPVRRDGSSKFLLLPSLLRCVMRQELSDEQDVETYCLSWFHPDGILSKQLPLDPMDESDEEHDEIVNLQGERSHSPRHFAPSGQESYVGSEDEAKNARKYGSRSPTPLLAGLRRNEISGSDYAYCLYQWNSYREAIDILCPFGYAPSFVQVSYLFEG